MHQFRGGKAGTDFQTQQRAANIPEAGERKASFGIDTGKGIAGLHLVLTDVTEIGRGLQFFTEDLSHRGCGTVHKFFYNFVIF